MPPKLSNPAGEPTKLKPRLLCAHSALCARALDALYPPRCAGCNDFCQTLFCPPCRATLQSAPAFQDVVEACEYSDIVEERAAPSMLPTRAALLFDGALREAVHRFKYGGKTALAVPLSQLMLETLRATHEENARAKNALASTRDYLVENILRQAPENARPFGKMRGDEETLQRVVAASASTREHVCEGEARIGDETPASTRALFGENVACENAPIFLVPVPLHAWRKWRRGYNQSDLLARELSRLLAAPCVSLLRRARYTATQTEFSRGERLRNVEGAFALNANAARVLARQKSPFTFVLIDDVYTTGATLEECARVLRLAFPVAEICAWTLAYQPPH